MAVEVVVRRKEGAYAAVARLSATGGISRENYVPPLPPPSEPDGCWLLDIFRTFTRFDPEYTL